MGLFNRRKSIKKSTTKKNSTNRNKSKNTANKTKQKEDENKLYVFRRYGIKQGDNQKRHPKLIVDATQSEYGHLGLTESKKNGKHNNMPIHNPQRKKPGQTNYNEISYLRKDLTYDKKSNYGEILKDYNLNKDDKEYIKSFVERKIKNKKELVH